MGVILEVKKIVIGMVIFGILSGFGYSQDRFHYIQAVNEVEYCDSNECNNVDVLARPGINLQLNFYSKYTDSLVDDYFKDAVCMVENNSGNMFNPLVFGDISEQPGVYRINLFGCNENFYCANRVVYYVYQLTSDNAIDPFKVDETIYVNKSIPLPKGYYPKENKQARSKLNKMLKVMRRKGMGISLISGFRSYATQKKIYERYVKKDGLIKASRYSAKPGHSEHQTGLAFDIGRLSASFAKTRAYKWLRKNAHKYGFILRYPKGKESITGYMFEPWHYRYVGVDLAKEIYYSKLTLEEYFSY